MTYTELSKLPAEAYLNPELFKTPWNNPGQAERQFQAGLKVSNEWDTIVISERSVWFACKEDSSLQSYEGIGYHAHTDSLLQGFLAGSAEIIVRRKTEEGNYATTIKPSSK